MSGSLVLIDSEILTGTSASVTLTGISTTYNIYLCEVNAVPTTDDMNFYVRVTKSGTPQTDSEYDVASIGLRTDASFVDDSWTNSDTFGQWSALGNGAEGVTLNMWLYNFQNAKYSTFTASSVEVNATADLFGYVGIYTHTVESASDGLQFYLESSDTFIVGSEFKLYGLKK